jgi:hypothetical protein
MKKFVPSVVSIGAGILLIIIGYRLDIWISRLAQIYRQDSNGPFDWMAIAYFGDVIMVSLLLAWLWMTHRRVERNRLVALVYVVLGIGCLFYTIVASFISSNSPSFAIHFYIAPNSLASSASSFMIVFGLQRLIFGQSSI